MSAWSGEGDPSVMESAMQIAWNFLERTGEIDDPQETIQFLAKKIEFMIEQGQRNKIVLSNRAIAAFQHYKQARTIEHKLVTR